MKLHSSQYGWIIGCTLFLTSDLSRTLKKNEKKHRPNLKALSLQSSEMHLESEHSLEFRCSRVWHTLGASESFTKCDRGKVNIGQNSVTCFMDGSLVNHMFFRVMKRQPGTNIASGQRVNAMNQREYEDTSSVDWRSPWAETWHWVWGTENFLAPYFQSIFLGNNCLFCLVIYCTPENLFRSVRTLPHIQ